MSSVVRLTSEALTAGAAWGPQTDRSPCLEGLAATAAEQTGDVLNRCRFAEGGVQQTTFFAVSCAEADRGKTQGRLPARACMLPTMVSIPNGACFGKCGILPVFNEDATLASKNSLT